jgi:hypothetical protein
MPLCEGVLSNFDGQNYNPDVNAETMTFLVMGGYQYLVYVGEFLDKNNID